jgi:hypothetical protein
MSSFDHVMDMMAEYAANRVLLQAKRKRHFRKSNLYQKLRYRKGSGQFKKLDKAQ